jgi:hypothetical protein
LSAENKKAGILPAFSDKGFFLALQPDVGCQTP